MQKNHNSLQASILDRLIDEEPGLSREPVQYRLVSVGQMRGAVIRDLENLLNTRRIVVSPPEAYEEVNNSLFVYGLKDYTAHNPKSPTARQQLRMDIEKTVSLFEPRLRNVNVHVETPTPGERSVKFRITAMLVVEPIAEPITFDTFFDIHKGEWIISR
ncbi:MAG: type VI secretion system baseplate subunit TssE [Syntrophobacteraceae bacterium]|nr:type VI secretion system baseplate subunit TssE [Syntrophobacteraceae bacterium]